MHVLYDMAQVELTDIDTGSSSDEADDMEEENTSETEKEGKEKKSERVEKESLRNNYQTYQIVLRLLESLTHNSYIAGVNKHLLPRIPSTPPPEFISLA